MNFFFEIFIEIIIKKILLLIIIREFDIKIYDINEYVRLRIYFFNENKIISINREFYIIDNLFIKTFIGLRDAVRVACAGGSSFFLISAINR